MTARLDIALVQAEIYNGATVIYFSAEGNTERVAKKLLHIQGAADMGNHGPYSGGLCFN